jgi:hypothetical protein
METVGGLWKTKGLRRRAATDRRRRGAIGNLMAELVEDRLAARGRSRSLQKQRNEGAAELIDIVRAYLSNGTF